MIVTLNIVILLKPVEEVLISIAEKLPLPIIDEPFPSRITSELFIIMQSQTSKLAVIVWLIT